MIQRCQRIAFEMRCLSRGYSIADACACIVSEDGDWVTVDRDHPAFPSGVRGSVASSPPGLGDMVAAGLAAVGITPERVSAIAGKPCACKKRQEALNSLGRWLGIG